MNKYIYELQLLINDNLYIFDKLLFKRTSKITLRDMFYYLTRLVNSHTASSVTVSSSMKIDKYCSATADAFVKKRSNIPSFFFNMLSYDLLNFHYNINNNLLFNKYRILAVDGTYSPLSKKLKTDNFKLTKNKTYVSALISGIYDIYNDTIVNLKLYPEKNERNAYIEQYDYLQKDDIIIHDRGYYSDEFLYKLYSINVNPIFRMKKNHIIVSKFIDEQLCDKIYVIQNKHTNNTPIKLRLIKYTVNGSKFILGTTILDKCFTIDIFKQLYKDRWNIETYFRSIKYDLSFRNFHSKLIEQEIHVHSCVTQLTRIFEELLLISNKLPNNYKTNFKNNIDKINNNVIKLLLYKKNIIRSIKHILNILFDYLIKIRANRSFARKRITPPVDWYFRNTFNK